MTESIAKLQALAEQAQRDTAEQLSEGKIEESRASSHNAQLLHLALADLESL